MKGNKKTITLFIIATMILSILSVFIALPVMAEPIVDLETMTGDVMSTSNQIFVLPLTFLNGALPPDNVMGLLVASIIFVVLITNVNEIEKVMRRLIFGHHPGPPAFFVSLTRWARVSVIAAIAELIDNPINFTSRYNRHRMVITDIRAKLALSGELRTVSGDRNIHTFNTLKVWT